MKTIPLTLALLIGVSLLTSNVALAEHTGSLKEDVVIGIDTNHDGQLDLKSIEAGQDSIIARPITHGEIGAKDSFAGPEGVTYVPIHSLDELRALDVNHDNIITAQELGKLKAPFITARFLEGTTQLIAEEPLQEEFIELRIPKTGDAGTADISDSNRLLIKQIKTNE